MPVITLPITGRADATAIIDWETCPLNYCNAPSALELPATVLAISQGICRTSLKTLIALSAITIGVSAGMRQEQNQPCLAQRVCHPLLIDCDLPDFCLYWVL